MAIPEAIVIYTESLVFKSSVNIIFIHYKFLVRGFSMAKQNLLRAIPQVDEVLQWFSADTDAPMLLIKQTVREELEILRQNILAGKKIGKNDLSKKKLLGQIHKRVQLKLGPNFKRVINATGVVIHTKRQPLQSC
jgi:hypothetical protein